MGTIYGWGVRWLNGYEQCFPQVWKMPPLSSLTATDYSRNGKQMQELFYASGRESLGALAVAVCVRRGGRAKLAAATT